MLSAPVPQSAALPAGHVSVPELPYDPRSACSSRSIGHRRSLRPEAYSSRIMRPGPGLPTTSRRGSPVFQPSRCTPPRRRGGVLWAGRRFPDGRSAERGSTVAAGRRSPRRRAALLALCHPPTLRIRSGAGRRVAAGSCLPATPSAAPALASTRGRLDRVARGGDQEHGPGPRAGRVKIGDLEREPETERGAHTPMQTETQLQIGRLDGRHARAPARPAPGTRDQRPRLARRCPHEPSNGGRHCSAPATALACQLLSARSWCRVSGGLSPRSRADRRASRGARRGLIVRPRLSQRLPKAARDAADRPQVNAVEGRLRAC